MNKKEDCIKRMNENIEQVEYLKKLDKDILQEISIYKIGDEFTYPDIDNVVLKIELISHLKLDNELQSISYLFDVFVNGEFDYDFVMDETFVIYQVENNSLIFKN